MRTSILALAALFSVACGSSWSNTGGDGGVGGAVDMAKSKSYPMGPYGNQTGEVLADFTVAGFRLTPKQTDSSKLQWDPGIKLLDYFNNSGCKALLISLGARWCGACRQEQGALVADVEADPTFCVLGILQEGIKNSSPATQADVEAWTQEYQQNFYVVQGNTKTWNPLVKGYGSTIGLPFNLILKPQTMQVVDVVQGFNPQIHDVAMAAVKNFSD